MNLFQRKSRSGRSFAPKGLRALAVPFLLPAALAVLPATNGAAEAASLCRQIEHRLASVRQAPRSNVSVQLDRAVRNSRAAGCGTMGIASPHDTHCRAHAIRIQRLRHADAGSSGLSRSDVRHERARLKAALRVNGCVGERPERRQRSQMVRVEVDRVGPPIRTMDGSIPVPLPRPASPMEIYQAKYVEHGESRIAAIDIARLEELSRPRPIPAARQDVRVVGGKFLAEPDEEMDFMTIASGSQTPVNAFLGDLLALMEGAVVSGAVAAEAETQPE